MTVEYFEPEMDEIEERKYIPFVGYINPRGQLIDYTTLIGYQTRDERLIKQKVLVKTKDGKYYLNK